MKRQLYWIVTLMVLALSACGGGTQNESTIWDSGKWDSGKWQ